ncbi:alpha/beta fold hydrolase [Cryptosporangium aurantiacum]|uniref:Pimeloyl-ACP methyl ester carboxylesterase n=1 Tax=Cryptosporangium aurantiacum TaxID=134849 RepID=A0A1M7QWP2_9ACTN|nr:alpha/beta hydrolase [Cryptosporangium aurantiacum]SHN36030.1 Pimeloyl-ACP methyl ester carboxylesterase [Cryptosporangium aurantiacum]
MAKSDPKAAQAAAKVATESLAKGGMTAAFGLAGALVGALAAGAAAGVAAERFAVRRRRRAGDPYADEPFGALPYDSAQVVTADGVDLYVEIVEADGEPDLTVIFVHGFALDMGTWHFQRRVFTGHEDPRLRMVFYDQPGHGHSGPRPDGDYTIDQLADSLAEVIAKVAPDGPLVLAGHSMGGMTLMALAERHSELVLDRVVGVALISTSAGHLDDVALGFPPIVAWLRGALTPTLAKVLRWQPTMAERGRRSGSDLAYLLTERYGFGTSNPSPALVEYVERMNDGTKVEVIAGYLATLSQHDRYAALEAFADLETLVVCGDRDQLTPVEHTREIANLLPKAALLEIPDGGHCTLMEHADATNDALAQLFQRAAAVAAGRRPTTAPERTEVSAAKQRRGWARRAGKQQRRALDRILRRKGA